MRIGWSTCRTLQSTGKGFYFHFPRSLARRRSFGSSRYPPLYVKVTRDEERLRGRLLIGSLSSDVFERRTSTGNGLFAHLSRDFEQIFGQIVSIRIKTLGNINTVA